MEKTLRINTGSAVMLNEHADIFSNFDSFSINTGSMLISQKVYDKMMGIGASINAGSMKILNITGELVELPGNTVITASMAFDGCFLVCEGNLVIEDISGLKNITGLYANAVFHAESVDIKAIGDKITAPLTAYPDGAKLRFGDMALDDGSPILMEDNARYWVDGAIKALDGGVIEKLALKKVSFQCKKLIIHTGFYEKHSDMFRAGSYLFIPDDHAVADDITLDASTPVLYGEKLFILGDLMVPHNQSAHLRDFTSLTVHGTATMPVSAAADFKKCGKAGSFELYEGVLISLNGFQTIGREQLRSALERGICYTLRVNGALYFHDDVTAQDMDAIAAVSCNGVISAPDRARGTLDAKIKDINGTVIDIDAMLKKIYGEDFTYGNDPIGFIQKALQQINGGGEKGSGINAGSYRI